MWSRPILQIAPELGLSNVGLAKLCHRHDIPTPGRGHWARVAAGKKQRRAPLPKLAPGDSPYVFIQRREEPDCATPHEPRPEALVVRVRTDLRDLHPVAASLRKLFDERQPDTDGLICVGNIMDAPSWRASPPMVGRLIRVLDAFVRAVEARGHEFQVHNPQERWARFGLAVKVPGHSLMDSLRVSLTERLTQSPHKLTPDEVRRGSSWAPKFDQAPSGKLVLSLVNLARLAERRGPWPRTWPQRLCRAEASGTAPDGTYEIRSLTVSGPTAVTACRNVALRATRLPNTALRRGTFSPAPWWRTGLEVWNFPADVDSRTMPQSQRAAFATHIRLG